MFVYIENQSTSEFILVDEVENEKEANKLIANHEITRKYNQPFWRHWMLDGRTYTDVGSWSYLFVYSEEKI